MKSLKLSMRSFSSFPRSSLASLIKRVPDAAPAPLSENEITERKRSEIFSKEMQRQNQSVGRIEKIEVQYKGPAEDTSLIMNARISTPYDCAKHMTETLLQQSALARVNGKLWDMHRPLEENCELQFLQMKDSDPYHANKAFWRSCSLILGAVAQNAFKDKIKCHLHSFPSPNVKSGSFVYDVQLGLDSWEPTKDELRVLSAQFLKMVSDELKFERLVVDAEVAEEIFFDNPHKLEQIPQIATQLTDDNKITLYRIGNHVDISRGPMVGNSSLVGRATITAVHKLGSGTENLYRFQGVALPKGFILNHFAYGILEDRAGKLNKSWIPGNQSS